MSGYTQSGRKDIGIRKFEFVTKTQCAKVCAVCIKCLFFDDEMCTLQKVGGEDSKGRRVL